MTPSPGAPARVVLLAGDGPSTRAVYHRLAHEFPGMHVVLEGGVSTRQFLRRRLKKLGLVTVAGQVLFVGLVGRALRRSAEGRVRQIMQEHGLDDRPIDGPVTRVSSVNSPEAREALRALEPQVVVVNGTRIIGRETLSCVSAPFINTHAGITPAYRGVHGGYWALAEGTPELVGTTVHLVDEGIDTGTILEQATFAVTPADSFATYPYLHTAAGLPPLVRAVHDALEGTLEPKRERHGLPSVLRTHPTLWGYLARRVLRGVR